MRIGESISKLLVVVILVGILTLAAYVPPSRAVKTWIVDDNGPADFHTIQEAVNAAGDGDTILVKQGTYYEETSLSGKHDLVLIAENQNAIIDGSKTGQTFFSERYGTTNTAADSENIRIIGFTVQNGLWVDQTGKNTTIVSNLIRNATVTLGYVDINYEGGWFVGGNYTLIDNIVQQTNVELWINSGMTANNSLINSDLTIEGGDPSIIGNLFCSCETALLLRGGDAIGGTASGLVKDNRVFACNTGFSTGDDCAFQFESNYISNCIYAIYSDAGEGQIGGSFFNNTIKENEYGVNFNGVSTHTFLDMIFYHNRFINNVVQVIIPGEDIEGAHAIDWNSSYPTGGNYWSDYNGTDVYHWPQQTVIGPDGIGDTPYQVLQPSGLESNKDYYPLMPPRFGKIDVGNSRSNLATYFYGGRYQASEDCFAQSISVYVEEMNGQNTLVKVAIYADSAGKPTTLIAQGTSTVPAGYRNWFTVKLSTNPSLLQGNYYWLVANAIASGKALRFAYSAGATNQALYGTTSYANFPSNPCVYSSFFARAYSIHCNYLVNEHIPPYVLNQVPDSNAHDVAVNAKVQVTFTEAMNKVSVQNAFSINSSVSGLFTWSPDGAIMTFTPNSPLAYGTSYTVTISSGAMNLKGQNMPSAYSWGFTTVQSYPKFGKVDVGSSRSNLCSYLYGSRYQMLEYGTAQSLALYVEETNGLNTALEVALYNDNSGVPTTLLSQGATTVMAGYSGWITVALSTTPQLIKNNYYWLVADAIASGKALRIAYGTTTTNQAIYGTTSLTSFPTNPCTYSGFKTRAYSIYCNYAVSAQIPGTFGKLNAGTSMSNVCQYSYGSRYQISQNGIAQSIAVEVWEMNGENKQIKVAIYSDNAGKPAALLATGTGTVPAGINGWVTIDLTTHPNLSAGGYYWLDVNAQASGKSMRMYYSAGTTNQSVYDTNSFTSFPTNPCVYAGLKDRAYSIYCKYFLN